MFAHFFDREFFCSAKCKKRCPRLEDIAFVSSKISGSVDSWNCHLSFQNLLDPLLRIEQMGLRVVVQLQVALGKNGVNLLAQVAQLDSQQNSSVLRISNTSRDDRGNLLQSRSLKVAAIAGDIRIPVSEFACRWRIEFRENGVVQKFQVLCHRIGIFIGRYLDFAILQTEYGIKPYSTALGAVGVADQLKGQVAMAFAVLKDGSLLSDASALLKLEGEIMKVVDNSLGAVARPARVRFVAVLPKTRSGKLLRRAIQAVCEGRDPGDLTTMDDPTALLQISDLVKA